jgi:hypothetical protein
MFIHSNRNRPRRYRSWSGPARQHSGSESASLIVVCGLSLVGLTISLFVLGSPRIAETFAHRFAIAFLAAGIIAAGVGAVVSAVGRSDE